MRNTYFTYAKKSHDEKNARKSHIRWCNIYLGKSRVLNAQAKNNREMCRLAKISQKKSVSIYEIWINTNFHRRVHFRFFQSHSKYLLVQKDSYIECIISAKNFWIAKRKNPSLWYLILDLLYWRGRAGSYHPWHHGFDKHEYWPSGTTLWYSLLR